MVCRLRVERISVAYRQGWPAQPSAAAFSCASLEVGPTIGVHALKIPITLVMKVGPGIVHVTAVAPTSPTSVK